MSSFQTCSAKSFSLCLFWERRIISTRTCFSRRPAKTVDRRTCLFTRTVRRGVYHHWSRTVPPSRSTRPVMLQRTLARFGRKFNRKLCEKLVWTLNESNLIRYVFSRHNRQTMPTNEGSEAARRDRSRQFLKCKKIEK